MTVPLLQCCNQIPFKRSSTVLDVTGRATPLSQVLVNILHRCGNAALNVLCRPCG